VPHAGTTATYTQALIAGVSVFLVGNSSVLEILQRDKYFLDLASHKGILQSYDFVVDKDGAAIDAAFRAARGEAMRPVSGRVDMSGGGAAIGARVGVFLDGNANGSIDPHDHSSEASLTRRQ
jgi:hypothetical protein